MQHFPLLQKSVLLISASDSFVQSSLGKVVKCLLLCAAVCLPAFAQTATTTTFAISSGGSTATSVSYGTAVTLTATVMAGSAPVTRGLVKFCDATVKYCEDFHVLGTAQITSAGNAVLKFRSPIGSHSYNAFFVGTKTNATSTSAASPLTVTGMYPTATALSFAAPSTLYSAVIGFGRVSPGPTGTLSLLNASNGNGILDTTDVSNATGTAFWPSAATSMTTSNASAIYDFNGDGIPDILMSVDGLLTVYLGNGSGTFAQGVTTTNSLTQTLSVGVGDFNSDGIPDVAVTTTSGTTVAIFLGNGDGTFTAGNTYSLSSISNPVLSFVADFNHDGTPDLAFGDTSNNNLAIVFGNGDGTFSTTASITPLSNYGSIYSSQLAFGDFNGDGIPDFAEGTSAYANDAFNTTTGGIYVYIGNGDGTFKAVPLGANDVSGGVNTLVVADFNNDGYADLAIGMDAYLCCGDPAHQTSEPTLIVNIGSATGSLSTGYVSTTTNTVGLLTGGDFNGDGFPDLIINGLSTGAPQPLFGTGNNGLFTSGSAAVYGTSGIDASFVADFNGDGATDLGYFSTPSGASSTQFQALLNGVQFFESASASGFPYGTTNVEASYSGDENYSPSVSSIVAVNNKVPTTLALSVTPSSGLTAGQTTTLTATLSPYSNSGNSTNGESVTFNSNGVSVGTGTLSNGVVTFTTSSLAVGTYSFTAAYSGDANFSPSTSAISSITVGNALNTLTLTGNPTIGIYGQATTITATLTKYYGSTNGENINFYDGQLNYLGSAHLASGAASMTFSTLPVGITVFSALYLGDANNTGAESNSLPYEVQRAGQTTASTISLALTSGGSAVTSIPAGTQVTLTATVSAGGAPVKAGTVIFCDIAVSTTPCGPWNQVGTAAQLTSSGTASINLRPSLGTHSLQALFTGTNSLASNYSSQSSLMVTGQYPSTTTLTSQTSGTSITFTVGVSGAAPSAANLVSTNTTVSIVDQANPGLVYFKDSLTSSGSIESPYTSAASAVGTQPFSIAKADFNNNGNLDLVTANSGTNNVSVLLGNGDGTFQAQLTYSAGNGAYAVGTGDFNDDGNPDIAVTNYSDGTISILLGNGDGTFQAQKTYTVGTGSDAIAVADFNGDGILDLAVANEKDNTISILLGNGDGTFQAQLTFTTGNSPDGLVVADLNGDGYADLAVSNNTDGTVGILLGKGDGTFQAMVPYAVYRGPVSIIAADFNSDGHFDLAVACVSDSTVGVLLGNGDGTFQASASYSPSSAADPEGIVAVNGGSGRADLAVADSNAHNVVVLRNDGTGNFGVYAPTMVIQSGYGPVSIVAGDWNGDSIIDFATANNTSNSASALVSGPFAQGASVTSGPIALPGNHTLIAQYSGSQNFTPSTSAPFQTSTAMVATSLKLTNPGSQNPSDYGQSVTLTATLTPYTNDGFSTNGEPVTFTVGGTTIGTVNLASGVVTLTLPTLPAGTDRITASYAGDNIFAASSTSFTQTVRPIILTVTASNASRAYGAANPAFTGTTSGAVNGDTFTVSGTTTAASANAPGAYTITPTVTGTNVANYTVTKVNGSLTITQAALTVTATDATRVYGAANPALTGTVSGAVNGDTFIVSGTTTATLTSTPGTYPITPAVTGANLSNYTVTKVNGSLTIMPPALTVTATNATRVYGTANPTFTGTVSGAVNGDTFTVAATTTATPTSAPGAYPITPTVTGANLSDYAVTNMNGTLTVTQALPIISALSSSAPEAYVSTPVTFTAKVIASGSGAAPTGNVSFYDGTTLLGTSALSSGAATYTTSSLSTGQHSITVTYAGDINYSTVTSTEFSQAIVAAGFTFSSASGSSSLATASPGGTATYTLNVTPPSGITFENPISFAVTGLPTGATATFSPATVAAGAGSTNVTLTVNVPASTSAANRKNPFTALPVAIGLILLPVARLRRFRKRAGVDIVFLIVAGVVLAAALTGCGGGGSNSGGGGGSTPQNYSLTVTATSGSVAQNALLTLTVQ